MSGARSSAAAVSAEDDDGGDDEALVDFSDGSDEEVGDKGRFRAVLTAGAGGNPAAALNIASFAAKFAICSLKGCS